MRFFPLLSFIRKKKPLAKETTTAIKQRIKSILNNTKIIIGKNVPGIYVGIESRHKQIFGIEASINELLFGDGNLAATTNGFCVCDRDIPVAIICV